MDTFFAPAAKAGTKEIAEEIGLVSSNPVVSGLLDTVSGLLAVLDEHRQIVALNDAFLETLKIDDPKSVLGLRPGEAVKCVHAHDEPAGCGTTKYCSTCGAAIAIVSSLSRNEAMERICALSALSNGSHRDLALLVKSHPISIDEKRFLLLFLQDITRQQHRAALERTFFHDVNNLLTMVVGGSELLAQRDPSDLTKSLHRTALKLMNEVDIQRCLSQDDTFEYQAVKQEVTTHQVLTDIQSFFANHPASNKRTLHVAQSPPSVSISTDISLLSRILYNMVINAMEATEASGDVRFWIEEEKGFVSFCVWNARGIPPDVRLRVFQRNFSTKEQSGRGIGTFSMKLFGEKMLGGKISFTTSNESGTTFKYTHPT